MITPKHYQQQILDELEYLPSCALFMGTGSGKTYTSLFKVKDTGTHNLLVLCPARVVDQWQASIPEILPDYTVLQFKKTSNSKEKSNLIGEAPAYKLAIVVSLEVVAKLKILLDKVDNTWTVIVDESHKIKEAGTKRSPVKVTDMALKIGTKTPYKIILTATPTQKEFGGYVDYYTQLKFLGFMDMKPREFQDRYCRIRKLQIPGRPYPIDKIIGYTRTHELDDILTVVSRRYTPKFTDGDPVDIVEYFRKPSTYKHLQKERVYEKLNLESLSAMRMAKKTLTSGIVTGYDKFKHPLEYVDNTEKRDWVKGFLEDTDETIIIFYKYNIELRQLEEVCKELNLPYIVINGANSHKKADIDTKHYRVVLGQYNASGESIDGLQYKSHIVVYYAMPESSLEYVQSRGRIDRIGQEHLPTYYHLVMKGTIDEDIYKMTLSKVEFNEEVLNRLTLKEGSDV